MNSKFKLSVTVCIFYLTNFTFFFVSLTWRKQNKKQQHGGRLKLKISLYHLLVHNYYQSTSDQNLPLTQPCGLILPASQWPWMQIYQKSLKVLQAFIVCLT